MHLSFASLACGYPGTSGYCGQTCSLEADNSPTNIRRLPRRARYVHLQVTNIVPALKPQENPDKVPVQIPAQMITIKPRPQPHSCSPPAGTGRTGGPQHAQIPRTIMTSAPLLPGSPAAGDTNGRCIKYINISEWFPPPTLLHSWDPLEVIKTD